ncbi:MAG: nitrite reductase [Epsilonproteobacteria bacterium]|nr:nitrite reductase [Campylobacterota bacterium]
MKQWIVFLGLLVSLFGTEKFFVVEREDSSLAVIENGKVSDKIINMKDMNHGVVKFYKKDGYVITRDGYVLRFDPQTHKILNEYKTSKSAIGFVVEEDFVAVANYDDKSVDILSKDLKPLQKIITNSRNVGIKTYKDYLIFAQMDSDKLTILKRDPKEKPFFATFKEFENVGIMPFDAMIDNQNYIVGFFKSPYFGVIDLENMNFSQIKILTQNDQPVLKVPHFGFWSIGGKNVFIPAVGDNKVLVYDEKFNFIKNITTVGLPVFTALSPDTKYLAVTFSGEKFPIIQIIDTKTLEVIKEFSYDGKVLHVRWSEEKPHLYVSVNDTNKISVIDTNNWILSKEIFNVKKPSGIFIYRETK